MKRLVEFFKIKSKFGVFCCSTAQTQVLDTSVINAKGVVYSGYDRSMACLLCIAWKLEEICPSIEFLFCRSSLNYEYSDWILFGGRLPTEYFLCRNESFPKIFLSIKWFLVMDTKWWTLCSPRWVWCRHTIMHSPEMRDWFGRNVVHVTCNATFICRPWLRNRLNALLCHFCALLDF